MTDAELDALKHWVSPVHTDSDVAHVRHARLMAATLGQDGAALQEGCALPPLWHWLYFLEGLPPAELGRDGHPARGGFLPPIALPNRMWAGGRLRWHAPLPLGAAMEKRSQVARIAPKAGRSGPLVFVTVRHEIWTAGTLAIEEEQDLVYKHPAPPAPSAAEPAADAAIASAEAAVLGTLAANSTLLFRYSALTFNGHRIHYDADYCRDVEGYAGLVVHGPLLATWLAGVAQQQLGRPLARFEYRALSPAVAPQALTAQLLRDDAGTLTLAAVKAAGVTAMQATASAALAD